MVQVKQGLSSFSLPLWHNIWIPSNMCIFLWKDSMENIRWQTHGFSHGRLQYVWANMSTRESQTQELVQLSPFLMLSHWPNNVWYSRDCWIITMTVEYMQSISMLTTPSKKNRKDIVSEVIGEMLTLSLGAPHPSSYKKIISAYDACQEDIEKMHSAKIQRMKRTRMHNQENKLKRLKLCLKN